MSKPCSSARKSRVAWYISRRTEPEVSRCRHASDLQDAQLMSQDQHWSTSGNVGLSCYLRCAVHHAPECMQLQQLTKVSVPVGCRLTRRLTAQTSSEEFRKGHQKWACRVTASVYKAQESMACSRQATLCICDCDIEMTNLFRPTCTIGEDVICTQTGIATMTGYNYQSRQAAKPIHKCILH